MTEDLPVVGLKIRGGWCTLTLKFGTSEIAIDSHWLSNDLVDLLDAGARLAGGRTSECVSWLREVEQGHFVDFVQSPAGALSVVVTENLALTGTAPPEREWSARRGPVVFEESVDAVEFLEALRRRAHQIRTDVDDQGRLLEWEHPFPEDEYRELAFALRNRPPRRKRQAQRS